LGDRVAGVGELRRFFENDEPGCTNAGKARMAETGERRIANYFTRIIGVIGAVIPLLRPIHPKLERLLAAWLLPLVALQTGCSLPQRCPTLPVALNYCLQPVEPIGSVDQVNQLWLQQGDQREHLILYREQDLHGQRLVGLTPVGQLLFDAVYDNRSVSEERHLPLPIEPGALLSLIQLAELPPDQIRQGLVGGRLSVDQDGTRLLAYGDKTLLRIEYHHDLCEIAVVMRAAGLALCIDPLENGGER
jgi:hypothetical protein